MAVSCRSLLTLQGQDWQPYRFGRRPKASGGECARVEVATKANEVLRMAAVGLDELGVEAVGSAAWQPNDIGDAREGVRGVASQLLPTIRQGGYR